MTYYFTSEEMKCKCGCEKEGMHPIFMEKYNDLREDAGFPFIPSSAYRCAKHNKAIGGHPKSAHKKGRGVDTICSHAQAQKIISLARKYGFTGVGISQKGSNRYIHLDDTHLKFKLWSY